MGGLMGDSAGSSRGILGTRENSAVGVTQDSKTPYLRHCVDLVSPTASIQDSARSEDAWLRPVLFLPESCCLELVDRCQSSPSNARIWSRRRTIKAQ